jgi:hypothetical protein
LLEVQSELFEFGLDLVQRVLAESRGDFNEGHNWVGGSDFSQVGEGGLGGFNTLDGGELFDDQVEGTDDFNGLGLSLSEIVSVSSSGISEVDFSLVEDSLLLFLVSDFTFQLADFLLQGSNFVFSLGSDGVGDINSSLVFLDFSITFSFLLFMELVRGKLLGC